MDIPYDYQVIDVNRPSNSLTVVYESDNRRDAEQARDGLKVCGCEVYVDIGEKLYRVICPQQVLRSGLSNVTR